MHTSLRSIDWTSEIVPHWRNLIRKKGLMFLFIRLWRHFCSSRTPFHHENRINRTVFSVSWSLRICLFRIGFFFRLVRFWVWRERLCFRLWGKGSGKILVEYAATITNTKKGRFVRFAATAFRLHRRRLQSESAPSLPRFYQNSFTWAAMITHHVRSFSRLRESLESSIRFLLVKISIETHLPITVSQMTKLCLCHLMKRFSF